MKNTLLRNSINQALYGGALACLFGVPTAMAQDAANAGDPKAASLETITVVGSRIRRADIETSQPVFVLERADLQKSGLTSIGDVLQNLTNNGAGVTTQINNGNVNGVTQVNLRNCGPQRTLVLVNGRRWVTDLATFGAVDLSTIPFSIVERVEVLKDGASAVYGTDAICGVINITTRDNFDGAEASAYYGQTSDGDGTKQAYDFTLGSSSERANVVMNVSYTQQDPIFSGDRAISAVPLFGFPGGVSFPGAASSTTPYGRFTVPGLPGTYTLDPSKPGCRPNVVCNPSVATTDFRRYTLNDGFNFAPTNYIMQPQQTKAIYTQARYNISDNIKFKTEVLYNDRTSTAQLAAQPLVPFTVSAQSIYNPFGADLNGSRFRPITVPRDFTADSATWRFVGGFEGSLELFGRNWNWDASYTYGETKLDLNKHGFFNGIAFANATGPSFIDNTDPAHPHPACGTPGNIIAGCVPFNVFGGPNGYTPDQLAAVLASPHDITREQLHTYAANITGDLFELPAGPLGFAAGYEYRRDFALNEPDTMSQTGNIIGDVPALATRGGFSLNEFYAELNIPVLKDVPGVQTLEINVADRYSDYSNFGHTSNPKFGFRWKPIDDLLLRGNYSKGFRAPSVSELFLGNTTSFPALIDPCAASSVLIANPTVQANCRAAGVVIDGPNAYDQANAQINTTFFGNPNLQPEHATTKTLGLVYSPSYAQGLDIYLDWYNIKITNFIAFNAPQATLNNCYLGINPANCTLIGRDLTGIITGNPGELSLINASQANQIFGLEVEGYDLTLNYKFDTDFGKWHINWDNAYTSYLGNLGQPKTDLSLLIPVVGNVVGQEIPGVPTGVQWRLKSVITTDWSYGDFGATLTAEYLSKLTEPCGNVTATADGLGLPELRKLCSDPDGVNVTGANPRNTLPSTWYFDLQASWHAPWNATISGGIRNLFDKDPPACFSCFANSFDAAYRNPGRYYYVQYNQKF